MERSEHVKRMGETLLIAGLLSLAAAACKSDEDSSSADAGGATAGTHGTAGNAGGGGTGSSGQGGGGDGGGAGSSGAGGQGGTGSGDDSGTLDVDASMALDGGADAGVDAATCTNLTVKNSLVWCSVSVDGMAASSAAQQTVCVAPGQIAVTAAPLNGSFILGPWHHTDGDTGSGEASAAATVTVGATDKCIWICCPFTNGTGCPSTDQCP